MKLGYCSWLLGGKPLPEIFEFLHSEGCTCTSILQNIILFDPVQKAEAAAVLKQYGMTLCVHGNVQHTLSKDRKSYDMDLLQRIYDEIDWWQEVTGGLVYDCFSDSVNYRNDDDTPCAALDVTFDIFAHHAAHFAGSKIRYGIENTCGSKDPHDVSFYNCDYRFQEAFDKFGAAKNAGMLLDVGHAYVASLSQGIDFETYLDSIPFEICELHITDNHGKWDEHLKPGAGTLDYRALKSAMSKRGFDGPVNMEVCKNIGEGIYGFDLSQQADFDFIRTVLAEARDLFADW